MTDKLYTTAEIVMATGLPRGTITTRAKRMGFERNATGYTEAQVLAMILQPLELHRKSEANALELRERLNQQFLDINVPMTIVENERGGWSIEYRKDWRETVNTANGK